MSSASLVRRVLKPAVFVLGLLPAGVLAVGWITGGLGADPIERTQLDTGIWALTFLLLTLAVSPAQRLLGIPALIHLRRMLGLFGFFYVLLHFTNYLVLDQFFAVSFIVEDVVERPYITIGFTAFLLLVPLALTSTNGMVKRLGARRWKRLHRLVYLAAAGGVFHYLWAVKLDTRRPTVYGLVLVALLAARLMRGTGPAGRRRRRPVREPGPGGVDAAAPGR